MSVTEIYHSLGMCLTSMTSIRSLSVPAQHLTLLSIGY
jgi:hypothetical protein